MMKKTTAIVLTVIMLLTAVSAAFADDGILRPGDQGEEVKQLQEKLIYLDLMDPAGMTGVYDTLTAETVRVFQEQHQLRPSGIANIYTQLCLDEVVAAKRDLDPRTWQVIDDDDDDL